ncbi:hypothetical protein F5Y16DRAFT_404507 [Xylariaceae sp. FL0255]|nr:hypothetical protein F5Y16DRAFT_404507 [Xylariaceae sp. FL0255]
MRIFSFLLLLLDKFESVGTLFYPPDEYSSQWDNPSDILSLLLIIGGDIVQKAITQLIEYKLRLPGQYDRRISSAPVAFPFGWVAYAFLSLLIVIGEKKLVPESDCSCSVVNCSNGFARDTKSWILGRLLRDHEDKFPLDRRPAEKGGRNESTRIGIFSLNPPIGPNRLQENNWFLVGIGGLGMVQNAFAAGVAREPGASDFHMTPYPRAATIIGTRGENDRNDDPDAEVDLGDALRELSDVNAWAMEQPVSSGSPTKNICQGKSPPMPRWLETMAIKDGLPAWLGPKVNNAVADELHSDLQPSRIGMRRHSKMEKDVRNVIVRTEGVHGALMELEKWVPTAGLAMVRIFFPGGLAYNDSSIRGNKHKKFWRRAYHTKGIRKRAEEKWRAMQGKEQSLHHV